MAKQTRALPGPASTVYRPKDRSRQNQIWLTRRGNQILREETKRLRLSRGDFVEALLRRHAGEEVDVLT